MPSAHTKVARGVLSLAMATTVAISGCQETVGVVEGAIIGTPGDRDRRDEEDRFESVPLIVERFGTTIQLCTGTLISPSHVLTASHCVQHFDSAGTHTVRFGVDLIAWTTVFGTVVPEELVGDGSRTGVFCRVHPELRDTGDCFYPTSVPTIGPYDVAVIVLNEPVPPPWPADDPDAARARLRRPFHRVLAAGEVPPVGAHVFHVGYGQIGPTAATVTTAGTRRFVERIITRVETAPDVATVFTAMPDDGTGSARGDSGGPLLWPDAPSPGGPGFPWLEPPVAIHSFVFDGTPGQFGTFVGTPLTQAFVEGMRDQNGDGRYDYYCVPYGASGDATPAIAEDGDGWIHGFNPLATPDNDRDGDGYLDWEDIAPDLYNPCQRDLDGDDIADPLDNCPFDPNADQSDRDGDSRGDACDGCPDTFEPPGAVMDSDEGASAGIDGSWSQPDGVPDVCDICPTVYDPDQANCNLDAELTVRAREEGEGVPEALRTPIRGDACDPTPCPETAVGMQITRFADMADLRPGTIRVDALTDYTNVRDGASRVIPAREGFRFCRCPDSALGGDTPETRRRCSLPIGSDVDPSIELGDCDISDLEQYDRLVEDGLRWRWMTIPPPSERFVRSPEPGPPTPGGLRAELPAVHEVRFADSLYTTDLRFEWGWQLEAERWADVFAGDPAPAASAGLEGVLWTHTARGRLGADPTWDRNLSSHYWSGWLPTPYRAPGRVPICGGPVMPLPSSSAICPFCAGILSFPFAVGFRPCPYPDQFGVAFGDWTVLPEDLPPNEPFNREDMAPLVGWDGRWLAAVEPPNQLPERGLRFIALRPDLGAIGRVVIETDGGFRDVLSNCPVPGQCGDPVDPPPIRSALAERLATSPTSPPLRSDFVGVVSARRNELFVLGGRLEGGALARDAWVLDVLRNEWRRLDAASSTLGDVLAATFDATTGDLIVIDEVSRVVRRRVERRARLVRVSPRGEAVEVMASWPRLTSNDRFSIAPGHDGSLYVAASNRGAHVVMRLAATRYGAFRVAGLALGAGRIIPEQIHANQHALTVMVEHGRGFRARTYEERDFLRVPAAADQCF